MELLAQMDLTRFTYMDLSRDEIKGEAIKIFVSMQFPLLEMLDFRYNEIQDEGMKYLAKMD